MTTLAYHQDTFMFQHAGKVVETISDNQIVLDSTVFHPRGGGQDYDVGTLSTKDALFKVNQVHFVGDQVVHTGEFMHGVFQVGECVDMQIDASRRLLNAALHTAGHLICAVIRQMGLPLIEKKGFHFPEGPYVELTGVWPSEITKEMLEDKVNEAISNQLDITVNIQQIEEDSRWKAMDKGQGLRMITIDGFDAVPCGGTHLQSLKQFKRIVIRKIKCTKGISKISYQVELAVDE